MQNAELLLSNIASLAKSLEASGRSITIMEVCGTHTMTIARMGLRQMLPACVRLVSGPGCPVCVTDQSYIDLAIGLARGQFTPEPPVIATYGDMIRVPGAQGSLAQARASGARVEVVYAADAAVDMATAELGRQVVFLAVGFETTAPATALAVRRAEELRLENFSVLSAHKTIIPAMQHLAGQPDLAIDAFLCPGHVSVIIGWNAFVPLAKDSARPCVVAGFEPQQVLAGVEAILAQISAGRAEAGTVYPAASAEGNREAMQLFADVFDPADADWRALGTIPGSGLVLKEKFGKFDAAKKFGLPKITGQPPAGCRCGDVLAGRLEPDQCPLFAKICTPLDPAGPCMVSSEGACAAAYKYRPLRARERK